MIIYMQESNQSSLFKEVVEKLTRLIEAEGLEMAERAVATATAGPRSESFVKQYGVKQSNRTPCLNRVAGGHHGGREAHYTSPRCIAPGSDHATLWLKDGVAYIYRSEPYYLGTETIGEMYGVAQELGLDVSISADSSYFPGHTMEVLYTKKTSPF